MISHSEEDVANTLLLVEKILGALDGHQNQIDVVSALCTCLSAVLAEAPPQIRENLKHTCASLVGGWPEGGRA